MIDARPMPTSGLVLLWCPRMRRRDLISTIPAAALAQTAAVTQDPNTITIDPTPQFAISPWLYIQFMEPLGTSDSSVEAVWDYDADDWRKDFVDVVRDLAPNVMRFGGLYSRHYKWREGVGPVAKRPAARNCVWSGKKTNRVGTHEFVSFCRRVGAEPMYCVNFPGNGDPRYTKTRDGEVRCRGMTVGEGNAHMIAAANLRDYVNQDQRDVFRPVTRSLTAGAPTLTFSAGSVTAVELTCS